MGLGKAYAVDRSVIMLAPALVALALWSLPGAIQAGDAGEFATVMLSGGVPHPSGYPWMRLLGALARALWALGLPPAIAAALPPAMCGVAGWLLIQRCAATLGHAWLGAWVVLLCAASPLSVTHVNDSEVWGPHLLFSGLFLWVVTHTRARPRPLLLGLSFGVAVSHHLTAALLLPLAIGAALPRRDEHMTPRAYLLATARNAGIGVGSGLIGLLPYATLMLGRGGSWRWGETETLSGWAAHVVRADFGTFSLGLHDDPVVWTDSVGRALASVGEVFSAALVGPRSMAGVGALLLLAALVGAGAWLRQRARGHGDVPVPVPVPVSVGWAVSVLASALLFPAAGNIDPSSSFGAWILERFDLLTVLLLVVPLTLALARLAAVIEAQLDARATGRIVGVAAYALALLMIVGQLGAVLERGRPAGERAVERAAIDVVETPDPQGPAIPSSGDTPVRAIVFGTDDHRSFPVLYVQTVLGKGVHTLYIDAELLAYPWYRRRLRARVPTLPDIDKPLALIGALWTDPTFAELPIYFANVFSRPAAKLERIPEGMLWRVPPLRGLPNHHPAAWTPQQILRRHLAACARMQIAASDFGGLAHPRSHPWSADLWFSYVEKAQALAAWLQARGHGDAIDAISAALEARTGEALERGAIAQ